jgi:acyl-CoA synthetase (AMP-forming)/AMP-acid ligase II
MAETPIDEPGTASQNSLLPLAHYEAGWKTLSFLPDSRLTFPELFGQRCIERPDATVVHEVLWSPPGDPEARPWTYAHFAERARWTARTLAAHGVAPGDRVLLSLQNVETFFSFFLAAQCLGAVPVPLPSASEGGRPAAFRNRIAAVAADCAPRAIVVDGPASLEILDSCLPAATARVDASVEEQGFSPSVDDPTFSWRRAFAESAFIQYTSGSTGTPKGVVVTHYNLVANLRASAEAGRFSATDRNVFWLPLYHDMGLIGGLLFGIYLGIPVFAMPPRSFVSRPDSWLRAVSRWKATFTIGPNFAYNILSDSVPTSALAGIDLSSLRLAFNGAEPIDKATLEAFARRFEPYGFRATSLFPVYGMAETTLSTAFPVPGAPLDVDTVDREALSTSKTAVPTAPDAPNSVAFVSVGTALPGHRVLVRSPDGPEELGERRIGEVVVSGPSVTPCYFEQGHAPVPRDELRTGDLGYVADGKLYIVDRLKELMIVAGRNLVPSDVERIAATVEGVRFGSVIAFAKAGSYGTEELYVVAGVEPQVAPNAPATRAEIRRRIHEHIGVSPRAVMLVDPRAVPKTSSGKIQRAACRSLYVAGALVEVDGDRS